MGGGRDLKFEMFINMDAPNNRLVTRTGKLSHLLEWAIKGKVAQFHLPYFKQIHLSIETRSKILAAIDPGKWKLQLFSLSK